MTTRRAYGATHMEQHTSSNTYGTTHGTTHTEQHISSNTHDDKYIKHIKQYVQQVHM